MAVAGSLVVNVAADASKLEAGFARARGASKGFAADTINDLRRIDKEASKFAKGFMGLGDAKSFGNLLGFGLGGAVGGAVGGAAFDAGWKAITNFIDRAEKGAALVVEKLNEAERTGKRLEGIELIDAHAIRNAAEAWERMRGKDDGGVGAAGTLAPGKEALALGFIAAQEKLAEHAQTMQRAWGMIPDAVKAAVPGAKQMEQAMQVAANFGKDIADASKEHAEATKRAAELQQKLNEREFRKVAPEADAGLAWVQGAAGAARAVVEAAQEDRARRSLAQRALAEQERMAAMERGFQDHGGTRALMAGSAEDYSASQRARRMVEANANKPDAQERDLKRIAERQLKAEEEQVKKLDEAVKELKDIPRMKVFKL